MNALYNEQAHGKRQIDKIITCTVKQTDCLPGAFRADSRGKTEEAKGMAAMRPAQAKRVGAFPIRLDDGNAVPGTAGERIYLPWILP